MLFCDDRNEMNDKKVGERKMRGGMRMIDDEKNDKFVSFSEIDTNA